MGNQNIDHPDLTYVFNDPAKRSLPHCHTAVERHGGENLFHLTGRIKHHTNINALAQIRHDAIRYQQLELRVDLTNDQNINALSKAHMNRRKAIEGEFQNIEDHVDILLHTASFKTNSD